MINTKAFNVILVLLISFTIYGCGEENLEGIYIEQGELKRQLLIIKVESGYDCTLQGESVFRYKKSGRGQYTYREKKLESIDANKVMLINRRNKKENTFKKTQSTKIPIKKWYLYRGMKKSKIIDLFEKPDTSIITESKAEKLYYANGIAIVFDEQGLIMIFENQKINRDFTSIAIGMQREEVLKLLGSPERERREKDDYSKKTMYYGLRERIVLKDDIVYEIILNEEIKSYDKRKEHEHITDKSHETKVALDDEINKLIGQKKWHKQKKEDALRFTNQILKNKTEVINPWEVVGIYTKEENPIINFPFIMVVDKKTKAKVPSLELLENQVNGISVSLKDISPNKDLSNIVKNLNLKQPLLIRSKNMIILEAEADFAANRKTIVRQVIFYEDYRFKIIQIAYLKGKHEKYIEDFNKVVGLMEKQ